MPQCSHGGTIVLIVRGLVGFGRDNILLEEGEVYTAVLAVLDKAGMLAEVVVLAVFYDEQAILSEEATFQNHVGEFGDLGQDVGRVGKDEVELFSALAKVLEHVTFDGDGIEVLKFVYETLDKLEMKRVLFHTYHTGTTTGKQFQRYAASSCKKVQSHGALIPIHI